MTTPTPPGVELDIPSAAHLAHWESELRRCPDAPESIVETASLRKLLNACRQLERAMVVVNEALEYQGREYCRFCSFAADKLNIGVRHSHAENCPLVTAGFIDREGGRNAP